MRKKVIGKPCEGELHARIDEELLVKSEEETSDLLYNEVRAQRGRGLTPKEIKPRSRGGAFFKQKRIRALTPKHLYNFKQLFIIYDHQSRGRKNIWKNK